MIEKFKSEDDGVSPVIGVILLVAVTVALVALATVIVFDIGSDVSETADATVQFNPQGTDTVSATVIRNENVDSFTLRGTTVSGSSIESSLSSGAGSTATVTGVSTSTTTETGIGNDDTGTAIDTSGDQVTLINQPVLSLDTVLDSGGTDITSDFSLINDTTIEYSGSNSLTSIDVTYDYESSREDLSTATVIATLEDGTEEVLTSTDVSG